METVVTTQHPNIEKALKHLKLILVKGETLDAWAIQPRIFALTNRRHLIAATSVYKLNYIYFTNLTLDYENF
jgi:hypothetical protein